MKLHELNPNEGAKRPRKRVGRGISAGQGKTAGRGTKGAGARAGGGTPLYHQGGNLPFFRRLPFKRGFVRINRLEWNEVNLDSLSKFKSGSEVTPASLEKSHLIRDPRLPVALLGRGDVKTALKVRVHRVSENAKAKIEAAGGSVELLSLNG